MQRRGLLFLVIALGLVSVVAVPAAADHAYSHRYYIFGRIVDDSGAPLQGVKVDVSFKGLSRGDGGPCPGANPPTSSPTTDATGRYFICRHVHSFSDTGTEVTITAGGASETHGLDPDHRRTVQHFQLPSSAGQEGDTQTFESQLILRGIAWRPSDGRVEGISVNGVALADEDVEATLELPDGTTKTGTATTDNYGDFIITFDDVPAAIQGSEVTLRSTDPATGKEVTKTYKVGEDDARYRYMGTPLVYPERPTDLSWLWWVGGIILVGGVSFGGYRVWQRKSQEREVAKAREKSTRKRANK